MLIIQHRKKKVHIDGGLSMDIPKTSSGESGESSGPYDPGPLHSLGSWLQVRRSFLDSPAVRILKKRWGCPKS